MNLTKTINNDPRNKMLELRSLGYSLDRISTELKLPKSALINWLYKFWSETEANNSLSKSKYQPYFIMQKNEMHIILELLTKLRDNMDMQKDAELPALLDMIIVRFKKEVQ